MTTQRIFVLCLTFMLDSILFVRIGCFLCHRINEFCLVNIHAVRENSVFLFRAVSVLLHKRVRYVIGRLTPAYDWTSPTPIQDLSRFDSCLLSICLQHFLIVKLLIRLNDYYHPLVRENRWLLTEILY